jgi:hypothetical protein
MTTCRVCRFYDTTDGGRVCRACRAARVVLPAARAPTLPGRTEAEIQAEIVAYLRLHGWDVTVTSAHRHAKGVTAGTPDLYCRRKVYSPIAPYCVPPLLGQRVWIEVKRPGGRVSDAQGQWHAVERACGGTVIVAYSTDDVVHLTGRAM